MVGLDNQAFAASKLRIAEVLTNDYLLANRVEVLDLFDKEITAAEIVDRVYTFLDQDRGLTDLVIYYCGHGAFLPDRSYYLTLKSTRQGREATTGLLFRQFRLDLDDLLHDKRTYLLLDCCYAAAAVSDWMSSGSISNVIADQIESAFPAGGTALLVAASRSNPAIAPIGHETTLFSGHLIAAIRDGAEVDRKDLSLADLAEAVRIRIRREPLARHVLPEMHVPRQSSGDMSLLPLIRNHNFSDRSLLGVTPVDLNALEQELTNSADPTHATVSSWPTWLHTTRAQIGLLVSLALVVFAVVYFLLPTSVITRPNQPLAASDNVVSSSQVAKANQSPDVKSATQFKLDIPFGQTSEQIVAGLLESSFLTGTIKNIPPEGSLLPDIYDVLAGTTREEVLQKMQQAQISAASIEWRGRQKTVPISNELQFITLASIVDQEAEGANDEVRAKIASVLINRLRNNMKLQLDSTVIYGLIGGRGRISHPLTKEEITRPTPYNTYVIGGLPPGPICNPSRPALKAVANPAQTNDLYFIRSKSGEYLFAETYAQLKNLGESLKR